jgi:hypothetical protein
MTHKPLKKKAKWVAIIFTPAAPIPVRKKANLALSGEEGDSHQRKLMARQAAAD